MAKIAFTKKTVSIAGLLLAFLVFGLFLLKNAGVYLVEQDRLQKADAIVILMGSTADRVMEAHDLFKDDMAPLIIIVNNLQLGSDILKQHDVIIPNKASLSIDALYQLGIDKSHIVLLPGAAASTRDEAEILSVYLQKNELSIDTLIIVSSEAHMRRSMMIFEDTFNDNNLNAIILSAPSKYSGFNAKKWWTDRESAKQVLMEYTKIASFLLVEQWQK